MRDDDLFLGWLFGIVLGLFLGFCIGGCCSTHRYQTEAIEKGYAQYRTDDGKWTWKCDLEKAEK